MKTIATSDLAHVHGGVTIKIDLGSLVQQIAGMLQQGGAAQGGDPSGAQPQAAPQQAQQAAPQQGGFNLGSLLQMFGGLMNGGGGGGQGGGGASGAGGAGAAMGG